MNLVKNLEYEILTPTGWLDFVGMKRQEKENWIRITLENNVKIECTDYHPFDIDGKTVSACQLNINDNLYNENNAVKIINIENFNCKMMSYDILEVGTEHKFFVNDIICYNCNFRQSGDTVIDVEDILYQEKYNMKEPQQMIDVKDGIHTLCEKNALWIWQNPIPGRTYILSADVARGDGTDNSAFSIWLLPTQEEVEKNKGPEQVVEFYDKVKTDVFGRIIEILGRTYNNAIVIVENTGIGIATLNVLVNANYYNLYFTDKSVKQITLDVGLNTQLLNNKVPGFTTSVKTRELCVNAAEAAWRCRQYIIRSKRQIIEAKTWLWLNGRADHGPGCHDDLLMSSAFFFYLYQTSIEQQGTVANRYIGALNLVTERRSNDYEKMMNIIKLNQMTNKAKDWKLDYAAGLDKINNGVTETWNLTELIRR